MSAPGGAGPNSVDDKHGPIADRLNIATEVAD